MLKKERVDRVSMTGANHQPSVVVSLIARRVLTQATMRPFEMDRILISA
jgi:hypothetical protein